MLGVAAPTNHGRPDLSRRLAEHGVPLWLHTVNAPERMADARRLYEALGFVRCAAYYHNPLGAPVYMALDLRARGDAT